MSFSYKKLIWLFAFYSTQKNLNFVLPWSCERYGVCFAAWLEDDEGSSVDAVVVVAVVVEASSGSPRKWAKNEARVWALFTLPVKFAKSSTDNLQRSKQVVGNFSASKFSRENSLEIQFSQALISLAFQAMGSENKIYKKYNSKLGYIKLLDTSHFCSL